jgi:hypothetical protein
MHRTEEAAEPVDEELLLHRALAIRNVAAKAARAHLDAGHETIAAAMSSAAAEITEAVCGRDAIETAAESERHADLLRAIDHPAAAEAEARALHKLARVAWYVHSLRSFERSLGVRAFREHPEHPTFEAGRSWVLGHSEARLGAALDSPAARADLFRDPARVDADRAKILAYFGGLRADGA